MLWLRNKWGRDNVDWDPTGEQYLGAIQVTRIRTVYTECVAFTESRGLKAPSENTFRRIWKRWMETDRIRMRRKKNVSGKCPGWSAELLNTFLVKKERNPTVPQG